MSETKSTLLSMISDPKNGDHPALRAKTDAVVTTWPVPVAKIEPGERQAAATYSSRNEHTET